ncbi:MAG: phosphoribosylamine--glycine ligase [Pseudomonadales bacterium]|nr:phosphoribosylamine--glycine ligase [Pseudomonadales bacterium]
MNILVIGSGGREHALAWKLSQSASAEIVFVAPGNGGSALEPALTNIPIEPMDFDGLIEFAIREQVALTVVGPEAPLVAGIVDRFHDAGLACLGPSAAAAQLEGSKSFSKQFLVKHGIPTAAYGSFESVRQACEFARTLPLPVVIKADGLAAGKGVLIAQSYEEADQVIAHMLEGDAFGQAGHRVVIEEFLSGEEASFIVIANGHSYLPFATSQDHKALLDGDLGLNTGGMGAYSPAPVVTDAINARVLSEIIEPTLAGMIADGHPYKGFLYAGLMIEPTGGIKVVEFNCRFGDPETQPILLRMQSDLVSLCVGAVNNRLGSCTLEFTDAAAVAVVLSAEGYPQAYRKNEEIEGLGLPMQSKVFHCGTRLQGTNIKTSGGRVLAVTALGNSVSAAQSQVYEDIKGIQFAGMQYRRDIGYRAIAREKNSAD